MASGMATAIANRMAKLMRLRWQNYAPNPNPNPKYLHLSFRTRRGTKSKSLRYVTRETATLGLGR